MQEGELEEVIIATHSVAYKEVLERHPGAASVTARYRDRDGKDVVEVHYYRLPDGSIIPGSRPDPKLLFEDGVWYHLEKKKDRERRLARLTP